MSGRRTPRARDERGTASLEVALAMPVIALIFGCIVVMAQASLSRLKLEQSSQLAAMSYSMERGAGRPHGQAQEAARSRVAAAFFPGDALLGVDIASTGPTSTPPGEQGGPLDGAVDALTSIGDLVLPISDSRQWTTVRIRVEPVLLGGVFKAREAESTMVMDFSPWTFDEWSIFGASLGKIGLAGDLLSYLLWPVGMIGEVECFGGS